MASRDRESPLPAVCQGPGCALPCVPTSSVPRRRAKREASGVGCVQDAHGLAWWFHPVENSARADVAPSSSVTRDAGTRLED